MDLTVLKSVCKQLNEQEYTEKLPIVPLSNNFENNKHKEEAPIVERRDLENLTNFVEIWTDQLEIEDVTEQFKDSDFTDLLEFEESNCLWNLGFFYVKVNRRCSPLECLGLLEKIPFEQFCTPGTYQISYATLTHLFGEGSEELVIRLMVLGDFFKYWILVNPYKKMQKTNENTKLILSGMGNLYVVISPGYFENCIELVKSVELTNKKQIRSGQMLLY
jgi:hypothetical protein